MITKAPEGTLHMITVTRLICSREYILRGSIFENHFLRSLISVFQTVSSILKMKQKTMKKKKEMKKKKKKMKKK